MNGTLYDITLRIGYSYDSPAKSSRALLRMLPRTMPGQQLISGFVSTDPHPDFRRDGTDFFGTATTEIAHDAPLSDIEFRFSGRVQRLLQPQPLDLSCALDSLPEQIAAIRSIAPDTPHHFLGESDRIGSVPEIAAFAREVVAPDMSALGAVQAVSAAVHREVAFDAEATEVSTPPEEAFRQRRGVCQDFSHITIAALRAIGIPAGYVSGFLRTLPPPGQPRLDGADAMHAWVRAWCGVEAGWVELDPTNDMVAGADHIVVGWGRDYADVAPVKGSMRGSGDHSTTQKVDVIPVS